MNVVVDAYRSGGAQSPVIGRFRGRHLVGLRFPTTGASLATDEHPDQHVHEVAALVMYLSPIVALLGWGAGALLWACLRGRTARSAGRWA